MSSAGHFFGSEPYSLHIRRSRSFQNFLELLTLRKPRCRLTHCVTQCVCRAMSKRTHCVCLVQDKLSQYGDHEQFSHSALAVRAANLRNAWALRDANSRSALTVRSANLRDTCAVHDANSRSTQTVCGANSRNAWAVRSADLRSAWLKQSVVQHCDEFSRFVSDKNLHTDTHLEV